MRTESKAANGDSNTRQTPPSGQAVKATSEKLSKRMTVEQAFQEILRNCLNQIHANRDVVADRKDVEGLHQMRVGLRRLDSALDLFGDFFSLPKKIRQDLDWLGEQLGAARDWDVLRESTLPYIAAAIGDASQLAKIEAAAAEKSLERHSVVAGAVKSARYARLMQNFNYWLQSCGWREALPEKTPLPLTARIPGLAHDLLSHAQHRLRKRGKRLPDATPQARHKVRIAAKKARYTTEFFESLLARKSAKRYIKTLSGLQDELGRLNDMSVADHLLKDLTRQRADLRESTGFIRGYLAAYTESEAGNIQNLWKKFSHSRLPR